MTILHETSTTHTVGRLGATATAIVEALDLTDEVEFRVGRANGRPAITFDVNTTVVTSETERESLLCRLATEFGGARVEIYDCPDGRRLGSVYRIGSQVTLSAHAKLREGGAS